MSDGLEEIVTEEVLEALRQYNEDMPDDMKLSISTEMSLGPKSSLDSLALITIFSLVEERISDRFGVSLQLLEEEKLLAANGPLESVSRFAGFLTDLLRPTVIAAAPAA